jgi:hypothetical protein
MKKLALLSLLLVACSSDPTPVAADTDSGAETRFDAGQTTPDGGSPEPEAGDAGSDAASCSAAKDQLLKPIDKVSAGDVLVLSTAGTTRTLYVDASAGGSQGAGQNPRVYLNLETATRVDVTDKSAGGSTGWDLALKRPILFVNGGDGGPGKGGAVFHLNKAFEQVTAADATGTTAEQFFDQDCNAKLDPTGAPKTSFDGWYDYDQGTNTLTPKPGTWVVKGGTGKLFKITILSYYATSDGGVGQSGGRYTLKVAPL